MLENVPEPGAHEALPRLSQVHRLANGGSVWMGGARSLYGTELTAGAAALGWVIDLAGDLPAELHEAAGRATFCVFADLEEAPAALPRLRALAGEVAEAVRNGGTVYLACTHGLNRSGLLTGLVLRELGFSAGETVVALRVGQLPKNG